MYEIQQKTQYHWEPIENGEFDKLEEAYAAMDELTEQLGWDNLRVVYCEKKWVVYGENK